MLTFFTLSLLGNYLYCPKILSLNTQFLSAEQFNIAYHLYPCNNAKREVIIVHGFDEHKGRYQHVAEFLNQQGCSVICIDLPGHGESSGKRGHINRFHDFLNTLEIVEKELSNSQLPLIWYGHSMGGNIVSNYLIQKPTRASKGIVGAPWLKLAFSPGFIKEVLAMVGSQLFPKLTQNSDLELGSISKIPEVLKAYAEDPLIQHKITPRMFVEIQKAGLFAKQNGGRISVPTLLYHGNADKITSHDSSKKMASKSTNIQFLSIDNAYHEVHNDIEKDLLFAEIAKFIS